MMPCWVRNTVTNPLVLLIVGLILLLLVLVPALVRADKYGSLPMDTCVGLECLKYDSRSTLQPVRVIDCSDKDADRLIEKGCLYVYDDKTATWNRMREDPCLTTMEAAMRAMEPYTPANTSQNVMTTESCEEECYHLRQIDRIKQRRNVIDQWQAAKACWRKP